jgi:putative flavoprotein involved in K+ transport
MPDIIAARRSRSRIRPMTEKHDIVIVGGGQAGLTASYWLSQYGREHVILERATVAERWRQERWDSLHFQFPNSFLQLPGHEYHGPAPNAFAHYCEILRHIEDYRKKINAPVQTGVDVRTLAFDDAANAFLLTTARGSISASHVVLATGPFQRPLIPGCASALPPDVLQLHASAYRNPAQLPPGAVLVIGSGSSGCQIAEEIQQQGRAVYLSVGRHRRIPHRHRGRFMLEWLADMGVFDHPIDRMPGGQIPPPLVVTGVNGGHGISLRQFAKDGVTLLGRLHGIDGGKATFGADAEDRLIEADLAAREFVSRVDEYIQQSGVAATEADSREATVPVPARRTSPHSVVDLRAEGISTVIWSTGYRFDFDWVRLPIVDGQGRPLQHRGVTACRGAYFLGLHWMHTFSSGTLFGVGKDAAYVVDHITQKP